MSSIYLSIATLEDPEIVPTINSAINNAKEEVNIGVAFTTPHEYYEKTIKELPNVRHVYLDLLENYGLGKSRNAAKDMYDGEEYFLQVDAHTEFDKNWDQKITQMFKTAKKKHSLDNFVMTCGPGAFHISQGSRSISTKQTSYSVIRSGSYAAGTKNVPHCFGVPISKFPKDLQTYDNFIPAQKLSGGFILGDKEFPENFNLPKEALLNDEEMMQSVNLLYDNFALVHFNGNLPIAHNYIKNVNKRNEVRKTLNDLNIADIGAIMSENFQNFIDNNPEKCKKYCEYTKYDLTKGEGIDYYIPKSFYC